MDKEILKNKKVLIGIILIILIILFLFISPSLNFEQTNTTIQQIEYSDVYITKSISLGSERVETYSFDITNPVIAYLIVPKTIATNVSEIKTSGDFKTQVIQVDPILKLTQTNLSPGKKEFTIKTNVGENTHTTIAIIIPLIEYNSFSETEKEELDELIKGFSELDANYFTNEESKKIMEEFGTNTANVELKKKIDDNKLFFSSSLTQENFEEKYNKKVNINFEVNDSVKTEIINQLNTYFETLPESQSKYQMIAINIDRDNPRGSAYNIGNNSLELVFNNGDFWGGLPIFRHEFSHLHHDFLYGLENTMKTKYYDLLPFSKDWEGNITTIKADNQELKEKYYTYFLSTPFSKDWISINENIEYGQQLTEKNSITKLDDKLYKIVWADPDCEQNKPCKGFVKPYGAAAFREDITTFIEELVKDPQFFYKNGLLEQDYPYRNRYVEKINLLEKNNFITAQEKIAIFSQIETNSNSGQENLNNNNFNNYSTALQQLIDTRKTSEDQTIIVSIPPVLSTFDSFRSTLTNILSTRQTNSAVAFDSNYLMEISFKTEKDYSLPSEIIMSYSKRSSFVIWNGIVEFDEEQEVNTTVVPVLEGTTDLNIEFLRLTKNTINDFNLDLDSDTLDLANKLEENDLKKPIYLVSIIVDTTDFYSQITEKEIGISLPAFKSKKYTTKLTLIQNRCNENINYFGSSVGIELAKDKEKAILDSIVCLGQNFKESIIKEIAQIDVNMKQATTLGEQLIISAIDNDSESVKKLSEERTKQNQEFKKNYLEANDKLIIEVSKLKSYLRQAKSNIVDLNLELTDANNVRVAKDYLIDLNIIYTELDLKLDPTNIDVRNQLVEVEMMDINSIPNISEEVRIAYKQQLRNKYKNKYGSTWGYPLVSDLTKMHHMLEDELIELEKSFALLLLKGRPFTSSSVTSGNCPTRLNIIDSIYNPENEIGYNFQHYKDFRDVVKYLAFNTGYSMSSGSQAILGGERELTDIEKKLKNFQDYSGCKLNIVEFEDPSTAWYDVFKNDTESKIKEFKEQRDSLRERIQSKVKEKTGIEIIGNAVYNVSELKKKSIILNSGFQDYLKPRISFNSPYERIKINKTNATLLEMFETVDENTLVSWLGIKDYKPTHYYPEIDYLRENLDEAFNNSLKSTINSIAYTKFMDFVADMTTGEKLESELAYVDNLLTSQYVLITKKMKEKEDQEKINYLLYNVFTGKLDDNPDAEIDLLLDTTKGLREIKKKLFEGKSFVDIYNVEVEELIKNGISTTPPTFLTYPIADDWTAYEYGFGTESVNTKKIVNPAFISWKDTIKQKGASYEIITAFSNPVMRAEIDKDDIIARNIVANKAKIELATTEEEKQRLVLSKDEESQILLSIADYYYDVGLYEMALQNYDFIKYHLPNTNASQRAEKRIGQMGGNWRMFFGKMYWETFGSISKEFVSLKSIATYLAFYGFIKFVAIPEISAARLTKANTALKQDLLLTQAGSKGAVVTMKQAHEFASINAMKRGVKGYEIINGRLIPLNTSAIYQPSKAWLTTKKFFGTIRNSKTWKILTKDRLVSEAWYQNYVETTVSRKLAYEFSIYSPDEIVGNIIGLAGEGKVASAVKSANRAKQMGLITTRQLQYIDGEIRVLTAKNISSEVEFVSNIGVLQTSHANQQLLPLSSVQQTQMALVNPNIVKFDLKNVIKFAKLNKVIIADKRLIEIEKKLRVIGKQIIVLEGYISEYGSSASTGLVSSWQNEIIQLKQMENSVNVFVDYAGEPLDLACSVCGFSIHRAPDYYGNEYGPLEYSAHSEKQYAMKIPIGEELTLKSVRINGAPAKLKINQVIDPYRTKAIVVPEEISPTILKLNIYSPVPIKVNAPGTQIINPQAAQAHAISGINTTVSPIPMEQAPHGTGVDFEVVDEASNFSTDPSSWEQVNSVNLGEIPVGTEIQVLSNYPIRTYEYTLKKVAPDEIIMWIGTDSTQGFKFSPTRFSSLGRESFIDMTIYPQTLVTDTSAAFPYYEFEGGVLQSLDDIDSATFFGPMSEIRINTGKGKPISDTTNYFDDELDVIECVDVDLGACTFKANSATLTDDPTLALKGKLAQTINGKIVADMDKIESISISIKKPRFVISNLGRRMGDPLGGATLKIYDGTTEVAAITAYLNPKNPKKLIIILANQNDRSGYTFNKIFGRRFSEELLARVLALDQFKDITRIDWTSLTESAQNLLRNAAGSTTIAADGKIINLPQKTNLNALQKDPVKLNQFRVQKGLPELNGTELENLFSENVPKTQSIVKKLIKFFCASPCVFENGTPVEIIEEFSDIDIYGDFSKIGKSDIITYSYKLVEQGGIANALGGAPNLSTTHVGILESAMITGKTVATIQPLNTGKQAIIIYRPQELALLPIDSTGATRAVVQADVLEINEALARLNFENSNDLMKTKDVAVKSYLDFVEEINPTKAEEIMILREASDYSKAERSNAVKSLMFESEAELFYSPITGETVTIEEYLAHYYTDLGLGDFGFDFSQRRLSLDEVKKLNSAVVHRNNKFLVKKEKVFVAKATKLFDDYATGVFTGDTQKANFAKNQLASIQSELFALNNEGYLDDISPLFINRYKILIDELATQTSIFLSVTAPNGNSSKTLLTFTDITHESLIDGEFLPLGDLGFMDSTVSVVFRDNFALSDGTKTSANLLNANKVLIHEVDHIVQHLVGTKPSIMEGLAVNAEDRLVLSQDGFFVEDGYGSMYYFEHTLYKSGRIWENNEYGQGYYAIKTLEKGGTDISSVYGPTFETPNLAEVEAELAIWANNLSPEIIPQLTSFVQPIKPTSNLAFECHSPCNWTSTQSPIKIFSPSQTVNIDGDYEAKFVKEIRPIETYNPSTVNINKINSNGLTQAQVNQVFSAMQKGQAVAVISSHYSGGQEITIYTPKGTATTFTATTTSAPIQTIPAATTPINLIKEKILQSGGTITSDVEVALSKNYKLVTSNDKKIVLLSPEVEYAENIISRNWMQTYKTEYQIHLLGFYDSQSGVLFVEKPIFSEKNLLLDYSKLSNSDIVNIYSPRSQLLHLYFYEYYKYTLLAPNTAEANIAATKIKELILEFYQKGLISEYTTSPIVSKLISNDDSWVDEILNVDSILTTVSAGSTPTFRNKVNNLKIQSQIKPSVDLYPVASNHPHPQIDNRSLEDNIKASTGDICVLMGQRNSIENSYEIQTIENESFFQSLLKAIFGDPNLDKQKLSLVPSYISITGENGGVNRAIITGQTCTYYADSLGVAPGTTQTHNSFPVEEFERIQAFEYSN